MKFIEFVDNRYQQVAVSIQGDKAFSVLKDAEHNALQFVLNVYRFTLAAFFIPKVLAHYLLVLIRLAKKPTPDLLELAALQKASEDAHLSKQAKKIGMVQK